MARTNNSRIDENKSQDSIKLLYPTVNEEENPLPKSWCTRERSTPLSFSKENRRVEYKGNGKRKEAFNVQTANPIPPSCGLYYFEVKIISKGHDGYIGIGLSADNVNINKLPGWDKLSYSYHGDDGCIFCASGAGQPYGPPFTTGDIIGCGVNFIDNTCFFTKNGHNLGLAFRDIQGTLYPTISLQTPGEIVEGNFGQQQFIFDIKDIMQGVKKKLLHSIESYPVSESKEEWHALLQGIVKSYLVHYGYSNTAQAFANSTHQKIEEDISSIKKRQKVQQLLINGQIGNAIEMTKELYPVLMEKDINLRFTLECRNFIEVLKNVNKKTSKSTQVRFSNNNIKRSNSAESKMSTYSNKKFLKVENTKNILHCNDYIKYQTNVSTSTTTSCYWRTNNYGFHLNNLPVILPCSLLNPVTTIRSSLDTSNNAETNNTVSDYKTRMMCASMQEMLQLGKNLNTLNNEIKSKPGYSEVNNNMLQNAFSLVAYADPVNSPLGHLLHQSEREAVCDKINSAILENLNYPRRSVLELAISHTRQLINLMYSLGHGYHAFINIDELLH